MMGLNYIYIYFLFQSLLINKFEEIKNIRNLKISKIFLKKKLIYLPALKVIDHLLTQKIGNLRVTRIYPPSLEGHTVHTQLTKGSFFNVLKQKERRS